MLVHLPADHPTVIEAVLFARPFEGSGAGFAVGPRLLARAGVAGVAALRAYGPVLADARLGGSKSAVVAAARTLAAGGASRVTLGPGTAAGLVAEVAAALTSHGATPVVVIVPPETDDGDAEVLTAGAGRGRMTSRVAASLPDVEVLGVLSDSGVLAQANAGLGFVVADVGDPETARAARDRGATAIVLAPGVVTDPDGLSAFVDAAG